MNTNKMELIKELEYVTNYQTLGNKLMKWGKESNNQEIKECKGCLAEIGIYVAHLEYERRTYEKTIESYRSDKVRALTRARRVETELEEANKIVRKYNKGKELGL